MDIPAITEVDELVQVAGVGGAIILLLILLVFVIVISGLRLILKQSKASTEQNEVISGSLLSLATSVGLLADKVEEPRLSLKKSLYLFRETMKDHMYQKARYIGSILDDNDIEHRQEQIKRNIESEFKAITAKETEDLGGFKSVCGNIGTVIDENINWDVFLPETYEILFSGSTQKQKIKDFKALMQSYVDALAEVLEERGRANI